MRNASSRSGRSAARRENGAALFVAMLLLLIVTVMGIALLFTSTIEQTLSSTETKISKIFYAADSGVEYATEMLASRPDLAAFVMPVGVSSHYPGLAAPDMQVSISKPILMGSVILAGDAFESVSRAYESSQVVQNVYWFSSSARSEKIQASKTIDVEVSVYMKQQKIPE
jgi:type IV pilus assembly PilX-like protein